MLPRLDKLNRMRWAAIILLAFSLAQLAVDAQDMSTGMKLFRSCRAVEQTVDGGEVSNEDLVLSFYCLGYLAGYTDSWRIAITLSQSQPGAFCLPEEGVENEQLARIVTKWFRDNPEHLHESARVSVLLALRKAFPCQNR